MMSYAGSCGGKGCHINRVKMVEKVNNKINERERSVPGEKKETAGEERKMRFMR